MGLNLKKCKYRLTEPFWFDPNLDFSTTTLFPNYILASYFCCSNSALEWNESHNRQDHFTLVNEWLLEFCKTELDGLRRKLVAIGCLIYHLLIIIVSLVRTK